MVRHRTVAINENDDITSLIKKLGLIINEFNNKFEDITNRLENIEFIIEAKEE